MTGVQGPGCASCGGRNTRSFTVDSFGNRLTETDANGHPTSSTYDAAGNVMTRTRYLDTNTPVTWSYTYNTFNQALTATDPLGHTTTNVYDTKGNLRSTTTPSPDGSARASTTAFTYDAKGQLTKVSDPNGNATTFTYYPGGLVNTVKDAGRSVITYAYDARGNRTSIIDPVNGSAKPTTFAYDLMNRLTKITYPDGSSAEFGYDNRGRRISAKDGNGKVTQYAYDDADRLVAVTDAQQPSSGVTQYAYDSENRLTQITDAAQRATVFHYDSLGRLTGTDFPVGSESYAYDAAGNLKTRTDRLGNTTTFNYDALDRLTSKVYSDATEIDYVYDLASRLQQVSGTAANGSYSFAYDNVGRLTQTNTTYSFLAGGSRSVKYGYDAGSNRTSLTDPQGVATAYSYNSLNQLSSMKIAHDTFGFDYDALGRRTDLAHQNGVKTTYAYDAASRLLSVLHNYGKTTLDGATYTYDAAGNRLSKRDARTGVTSNYGYDSIYQLTGVSLGAASTESYSYDPVGNRLTDVAGASYTYNVSNQLTAVTGAAFTYDANGNLLTKTDSSGTTTYGWDLENRLTSVQLPGSGGTVTFRYDPFGRRIQKTSPAGTVIYLYDGANILQELDSAGNVIARYTQGPGIDEPLTLQRSGSTYDYLADGLGSVTSLSTASRTLINSYSYDSFGKVTASTTGIANPFRYTGREFDQETGLYYYRARYYDSTVGRFLSEDPIEFDGGPNSYAYVGNSPTNFIDPAGLVQIVYNTTYHYRGFWDSI